MRIVALEEHFIVENLFREKFTASKIVDALMPQLADIGDGRLKDMDVHGISQQVLSLSVPGAEQIDGSSGIEFAQRANDALSTAIRTHPTRFSGFAHLPTRTPEAAADELTRCVQALGFCGGMVSGLTDGRFLDDPMFEPLLARFETLDVPLYVHPNVPPKAVVDAYYQGLPGGLGSILATAGFGWHIEAGLHLLRMAVAGTFTRHPKLKVVIGHMGEALPFMLARAESTLRTMPGLGRPLSHILNEHLYITTSGFFTLPPFLNTLLTFGADRILFSVDYPYSGNAIGRAFFDSLPVSPGDKEKIGYRNADRLLRLSNAIA